MKPLVLLFAIFAVLAYASAVPAAVYDGPIYELSPIEVPADDNDNADDASNVPVRQARVTCDVLSWQSKWFSFNHSACAIKCLSQRRRGGRCRNGVCVCR